MLINLYLVKDDVFLSVTQAYSDYKEMKCRCDAVAQCWKYLY